MFPGHLRESREPARKVKHRLPWAAFLLFLTAAPLAADPTILGEVAASHRNPTLQEEKIGYGAEVTPGKRVAVYYVGSYANGKVFDTSHATGIAFVFVQGVTHLIPGWTQGVAGMRVGGRRRFTLPPDLAYGVEGVPGFIPANATLVYDVQVVTVE